jgi:hypothetical protein
MSASRWQELPVGPVNPLVSLHKRTYLIESQEKTGTPPRLTYIKHPDISHTCVRPMCWCSSTSTIITTWPKSKKSGLSLIHPLTPFCRSYITFLEPFLANCLSGIFDIFLFVKRSVFEVDGAQNWHTCQTVSVLRLSDYSSCILVHWCYGTSSAWNYTRLSFGRYPCCQHLNISYGRNVYRRFHMTRFDVISAMSGSWPGSP